MATTSLEQRADRWARAASVAVGALGILVVVIPAVGHLDLGEDPFAPGTQTKTVETVTADGKKTVETTTSPSSLSLPERSLGQGGLLLLRLGVVGLAAFLAGAVVQRTVLARYDVKVGALEIPAITEATEEAIAALTERITRQEAATADVVALLGDLTRHLPGEPIGASGGDDDQAVS